MQIQTVQIKRMFKLGALATALALAGCGGDINIDTKGETTTTPTPTPGPNPTPTQTAQQQAYSGFATRNTSLSIDGKEVWTYQQDVPALTLRGISGLTESQGAAFFGLPNGKIGGVLVNDGRAIWEAIVTPQSGGNELASIIDVDSTPIALGETIFAVGYNGNLAAIEIRTGKVLWKRDYSAFKSMTLSGFNLYLTTAAGHVVAIDRRSGLEKWSQLGLENRGLTAPVIFDDYVAVVDFEGVLHLMSSETGEFVGQLEIDDDGHIAKPIVDGNLLYLQSKDGLLSAISIK